jgi:asparaginyl-tRNA synthetase
LGNLSTTSGVNPVNPVVSIANLKEHVNAHVTLQGWLYHKTGKGKLQFLQVRDGTGLCQAVILRRPRN